MKTARLLFLLVTGSLAIGCGGGGGNGSPAKDLTPVVTATVRGFRTADPAIPNAVALVHAPGQAPILVADGSANLDSGAPMTDRHPFLTASIGKTITAATVVRLVERGLVKLERPASEYLPAGTMSGLHTLGGVDASGTITVRQLLNHTSGIADYVEDGPKDELGLSPFQGRMLSAPDHLWTPAELLAYTRENLTPANAPGAGWHYSDTNYVLLALIVERATGRPFHEAVRTEIFDPLGMTETYMPWREPSRSALPLSSVRLASLDVTDFRSLSADWGGGGFATTARDLEKLLNGVLDGGAFQNRASANLMKSWVPTGEPGVDYGLGLLRQRTARGYVTGHIGFFGSFAIRADWQKTNYVGTINQAQSSVNPMDRLVEAVESARR